MAEAIRNAPNWCFFVMGSFAVLGFLLGWRLRHHDISKAALTCNKGYDAGRVMRPGFDPIQETATWNAGYLKGWNDRDANGDAEGNRK
ncbi:MAG: hypothetical protein LAO20_14230 [Acidobacteriia bacterium]|nr:hypothetical protein [Terriglobia bacterium]